MPNVSCGLWCVQAVCSALYFYDRGVLEIREMRRITYSRLLERSDRLAIPAPHRKQPRLALLPFRADTGIQRQRRKPVNGWRPELGHFADTCARTFTPSMPCGIGSHRVGTLRRHCSRTLGIVTDIARDDEALQAVTRVKNPRCKG
jgi:hypothetical protein